MRGTVSNALLMSFVASSVRCLDLGIFRPLCMRYVSEVSSVVVEWCARNLVVGVLGEYMV